MADEKKIIIDEDWKAQVQAEKERASKASAAGKSAADQPASAESKPAEGSSGAQDEHRDPEMPPASFEMLLTTLATEALVALGAVPHPATGKQQSLPNQARFLIDTLEILKQKTRGNLSASEDEMLDSLLHQLRMVYVEIAGRASSSPPTQ